MDAVGTADIVLPVAMQWAAWALRVDDLANNLAHLDVENFMVRVLVATRS